MYKCLCFSSSLLAYFSKAPGKLILFCFYSFIFFFLYFFAAAEIFFATNTLILLEICCLGVGLQRRRIGGILMLHPSSLVLRKRLPVSICQRIEGKPTPVL